MVCVCQHVCADIIKKKQKKNSIVAHGVILRLKAFKRVLKGHIRVRHAKMIHSIASKRNKHTQKNL